MLRLRLPSEDVNKEGFSVSRRIISRGGPSGGSFRGPSPGLEVDYTFPLKTDIYVYNDNLSKKLYIAILAV